jgi:hypothetical protein
MSKTKSVTNQILKGQKLSPARARTLVKRASHELAKIIKRDEAGTITGKKMKQGLEQVEDTLLEIHLFIDRPS